jgi:hypothetical protein
VKSGSTPTCGSPPLVPLLVGIGSSNFDHGIAAGQAERLYLLDSAGAALSIEILDTTGGAHLDAYSGIVKTIHFGP